MSCDYESGMNVFLEAAGIEHFKAIELCRVGRKANGKGPALQAPPMELWKNALPTLQVLDQLRREKGPVIISSGYRDPAYNEAVGGKPSSLHLEFNAFDIRVPGLSPAGVYYFLARHSDASQMGLGTYPTFVHVDTRGLIGRPAPARW